jgi:hypothetical protein
VVLASTRYNNGELSRTLKQPHGSRRPRRNLRQQQRVNRGAQRSRKRRSERCAPATLHQSEHLARNRSSANNDRSISGKPREKIVALPWSIGLLGLQNRPQIWGKAKRLGHRVNSQKMSLSMIVMLASTLRCGKLTSGAWLAGWQTPLTQRTP